MGFMVVLTGLIALVFAAIHVFIGRLRWLDTMPRNRGLSFAGGVAVTYVFLHILPEIATHQREFADEIGLTGMAVERWIYALALLGLVVFYGVERRVKVSRAQMAKAGQGNRTGNRELWIHIGSFAVFNFLIGYLLVHREEPGLLSLSAYSVAMALHFVTADFGMRQDHAAAYDGIGRWVLAVSVIVGWLVGQLIALPPLAVGGLFSFLAGGVVLNVLKEELPEERQSRFTPFLLGVAIYGALIFIEASYG